MCSLEKATLTNYKKWPVSDWEKIFTIYMANKKILISNWYFTIKNVYETSCGSTAITQHYSIEATGGSPGFASWGLPLYPRIAHDPGWLRLWVNCSMNEYSIRGAPWWKNWIYLEKREDIWVASGHIKRYSSLTII